MKKGTIWKVLLFIGLCPFVAPVLSSVTKPSTWTLLDWIVMYSFIYWPTYIVGLVLTLFSAYRLIKQRTNRYSDA